MDCTAGSGFGIVWVHSTGVFLFGMGETDGFNALFTFVVM
jgi:hypothetical protein